MVNVNNLCVFEGRVSSDPTYSTLQMGTEQVEKAMFRVAVERALTAEQRKKVKAGDQSIKTVDFVPFSLLGAQVATLRQYFPKGTPIKLLARYTEYTTTDANSGAKSYGHIFEAENISFTVANTGGNSGGNNNQNANSQPAGNYQQQAPKSQPAQHQQQQPQQQSNFTMFDENDSPF